MTGRPPTVSAQVDMTPVLPGMPEFVRDRAFPLGQHRHFTEQLRDEAGTVLQIVKICDCACEDCMLRLMGECVCLTHCQCDSQDDHEQLARCYLDAPVGP